jgi:hypothetical protein
MHAWEKVKRFLGFDSVHGEDKASRRPAAAQFQKLKSAGILVENRNDDGIPMRSAYADKAIEKPQLKTIYGSGTIVLEDSDFSLVEPERPQPSAYIYPPDCLSPSRRREYEELKANGMLGETVYLGIGEDGKGIFLFTRKQRRPQDSSGNEQDK